MYNTPPSPWSSGTRLAARRATLRNRPLVQRALIRSWEYIRPVRNALLAFRLSAALMLVILGAALMSVGYSWGLAPLLGAPAVAALGAWVFVTAAKGWPAGPRP